MFAGLGAAGAGRLGRLACRWRWPVVALWIAFTLAGAVAGGRVFDRLGTVDNLRPGAESMVAERRIDRLAPEGPIVVAVVRGREPYDPVLVASATRAVTELRATAGVTDIDDPYTGPGGQIGADNRSILIRVELAEGLSEPRREALEDRVGAVLRGIDAPQVLVGGEKVTERAFAEQAISDAVFGESVAFAILLVALVVILGGLVAAAIALLVAVAAVSTTLLGLLALTSVTTVSEYAVNVVTLLGVGLAVDYSLLMIVRCREERAAAPEAHRAVVIARTMATAGRAVLISGLIVGAALAGLSAFAEPLLAAMALGGAVVVALATVISLTLVPAALAVAYRKIPPAGAATWVARAVGRWSGTATWMASAMAGRWWGGRAAGRLHSDVRQTGTGQASRHRVGLLGRLAGYAQRRPLAVALAVAGGLLLIAAPSLGANLANSDARALPRDAPARQAYEAVQRDFNAGQAAPVTVLAEADPGRPELRDLLNRLNEAPQVIRLDLRMDVPAGATVIDLVPVGTTAGPASRQLVRDVRAMRVPFPLLVTGEAAKVVDYQASVTGRLPVAVAVLLVATAVLLFALTGSVVVAVKALLMNAITLAATLGALVMLFQWGLGGPLLGFDSWGGLDLTTPVLLFVFVFGLSMDYEVFLLARIKEERDRGSANDQAVLRGIIRTGPVVTAAAACITIVFLGFVLGHLVAVKEIGAGMAIAVLLDVTVVRGLLLPAVMTLLGDWNWWAPRPLRRLHTRWSGRLSPPGMDGHEAPVPATEKSDLT